MSGAIHYTENDSNLFIIKKSLTQENRFRTSIPKEKYINEYKRDYGNLLPIPNFYNSPLAVKNTLSRLPENFEFYVIEAKEGLYYNPKYYYWHHFIMPEKWNRGYSKGIAVDDSGNILI